MPAAPVRVLVVDDDEDDWLLFRDMIGEIRDERFALEWASSFEAGLKAVKEARHDVCFFDLRLGARTGLDLLKEAIAAGIKAPMILLTGFGEHDVDLEAMRVGAADYLVKDQVSPLLLERSIRYSLHRAEQLEAIREREAQVLVQDRLASVGLLASSLAHEIGTPLGVIRGRAEYLALQLKDDEGIRKNADIIISQIDRVSTLIRSLLNLARGDEARAGEMLLLDKVVADVVDLMGHELKKHAIEVACGFGPGVAVRVKAEAGPLHQVILNLMVNSVFAIKEAIQQGRTGSHSIRFEAIDEGGFWRLVVRDTGTGISPENMRNLFKPFFTTKDIGVGTGLGLATSYRIVESWGGTMEAESELGRGTAFSIRLPKPPRG